MNFNCASYLMPVPLWQEFSEMLHVGQTGQFSQESPLKGSKNFMISNY